jgi:hypothetical protein
MRAGKEPAMNVSDVASYGFIATLAVAVVLVLVVIIFKR